MCGGIHRGQVRFQANKRLEADRTGPGGRKVVATSAGERRVGCAGADPCTGRVTSYSTASEVVEWIGEVHVVSPVPAA